MKESRRIHLSYSAVTERYTVNLISVDDNGEPVQVIEKLGKFYREKPAMCFVEAYSELTGLNFILDIVPENEA